MTKRKVILVADVASGLATIRNVVGPAADLVNAATLREAMTRLGAGADLVACGLHFDSSSMFDFLRLAKADPELRDTPFLCFRDLDSELSRPLLESLRISCVALGAAAFVDLYNLKKQYGVEAADARFRRIIVDLLDGALPAPRS